jgi:Helix-turn-helix domain
MTPKNKIELVQKLSTVISALTDIQKLLLAEDEEDRGQTTAKEKYPGEEYMNSKMAAKYLGVSEGTMSAWRSKGLGPNFFRINADRYKSPARYKRSDLDKFAEGKLTN